MEMHNSSKKSKLIHQAYTQLKDAYPFIYRVMDQHYVIGAAVFRPCIPDEIALFDKYSEEMDRLEKITYSLEAGDVRDLVGFVNKIQSAVDKEYCSAVEKTTQHQLCVLLEGCSETELEKLIQQKSRFCKALDYKDGAFYRHPNSKEQAHIEAN